MSQKQKNPKASAKASPSRVGISPAKLSWLICAFLALSTLIIFAPALTCDFVDYDDPGYIINNEHIQHGLTWDSIRWAFTTGDQSNWHPLTWLSHLLDMQLGLAPFGVKAGGHHLTSLLLHAANAVLLFLILKGMTGAIWRSAFVAALFALHPLRVESVAWVSERKDVLSTFFWMLTVWAYARYVEGKSLKFEVQGSKANEHSTFNVQHSTFNYFLALIFFALGLMSKPMLVTLPCVLLLLDFWPLNRMFQVQCPMSKVEEQPRDTNVQPWPLDFRLWTQLLLEKIPFFLLAIISSVITFKVQQQGGAVSSLAGLSIGARLSNTPISYVRYIGKMFWPAKLSILYPHPGVWPFWQVTLAVLFLAAITALAIWLVRSHSYLAVGWFWFIGMLVPAIGLVQVGIQSMADRYSYVPMIGLLIMLVWGLHEIFSKTQSGQWFLRIGGSLAVIGCGVVTNQQLKYWKNSEMLFGHAIAVTEKNYLACNNLGFYLSNKGQVERAMQYYRSSLQIDPNYEDAHHNLGHALAELGHYQEAIKEFRIALKIKPNLVEAHNNLGNALSNLGQIDEAIAEYKITLGLNPKHADAHNNFGIALAMRGKLDEAIEHFHKAIQYKPTDASAHSNLGNAFAAQNKLDEAIKEYDECLRLNPKDAQAYNNLGNVLSQQGKMDEAIPRYQLALRVKPENPEAHFNLGFCLAKQGRRDEAEKQYLEALRQQPNYAQAQQQLNLLRAQKP